MQKKHIAVVAVALVAAIAAPQMASAGEASLGADVVSAYVFRGATINDEVNVQPYLEGSFGLLTAGTWGNYNTDSSEIDEIDYYASIDLPLGEDVPVGVSLGYTFYTYPGAAVAILDADGAITAAGALDDDQELNVTLSADAPLSPSVSVNLGTDGAVEDSVYVELGLGHEHSYNESCSASAGVTVGIVADEADVYGDTGLAFVSVNAGVGHGPFSIGVTYIIETDDDVLTVDEDVLGVLSIDIGGAIAMLGE